MSETQKQLLIDISNISYNLGEEYAEKIRKVATNLLDVRLLEVMPKIALSELEELDTTEKIMLLKEYSLTEEERKKEKEEAIPFEEVIKEMGLNIDELQN